MKRLCLIIAYLFLFSQTVSAMPLLIGQKVVYRGTVTDLRISAVDGTAFIDNLPYTYSSDFSAGVDGFTAIGGTVAGNIDSIGGEDNWLRFTIDTVNRDHYLDKEITFVKGRKYNVTFTYDIPSGQSNIDGVRLFERSGHKSISPILTVVDSATTVSYTFTSGGSSSIRFYAFDGAGAIFQDPGGDDVFDIKDIKVSEILPYADGNHQIEIYDSSNRMLKGVLKAAGSGTLGTDNLVDVISGDTLNGNFETGDPPTGWTATAATLSQVADERTDGAGTYSINAVMTSVSNVLSRATGLPSTTLCKYSAWGKTISGTRDLSIQLEGDSVRSVSASAIWVKIGDYYGTILPSAYFRLRSSDSATVRYDDVIVQKVTAPSSSGATIVSAKGGTTYNFSYKNASFTYNASSHYVIIRAIR